MTNAFPFQRKTIAAVLRAFRRNQGARRFLVADEVGLGKTVVAQHVLKGLLDNRRETGKPLVVFYVCSNQTIARQNREQLLKVLPASERSDAVCWVDRLTLLAAHQPPVHPHLRLYSFTPATSLPMLHGKGRRDGRKDERALLEALLQELWPGAYEELSDKFSDGSQTVFQGRARTDWQWLIKQALSRIKIGRLSEAFKHAAREEFKVEFGASMKSALLRETQVLTVIAKLRNALAASALATLRPDLVIFDEFQRFRELLDPVAGEEGAAVLQQLRGEGVDEEHRPALLLLSATPYRFYSRRHEDAAGQAHHEEFFKLIRFLYGDGRAADRAEAQCRREFSLIQQELLRGEPASAVAAAARAAAQVVLRRVMARTERSSHPDGGSEGRTDEYPAELTGADLRVYRQLKTCLGDAHRATAVPYWTSIPLPLQSMGSRYAAWDDIDPDKLTALALTKKDCENFQRKVWPHPRLRALQELAPPAKLALPWLPPSLPWWPLDGLWKPAHSVGEPDDASTGQSGAPANQPSKLLIFSRFRAAPQAMAALLSYDLEAHLLHGGGKPYSQALARRLLSAAATRPGVFASFYPAPWLVRETEPLLAPQRTTESARKTVRGQIRAFLKKMGVAVEARKGAPRRLWKLLAGLEKTFGTWKPILRTCRALHEQTTKSEGTDAGFGGLLDFWAESLPVTSIGRRELDALALHALSAPGVVLGRALRRHWEGAVDEENFSEVLKTAWLGLRSYLDNPLFAAVFEREFGPKVNYRAALHRAVRHGNLESVLDEHLWITQRLGGGSGAALAEALRNALILHVGRVNFHGTGKELEIRLRCHTAMPFIEGRASTLHETGEEQAEQKLRAEELKKTFNTPFWPHVLSTTSVGQEGLDFHVWCSTLVHWDLCANPVDLEQREGRIQRFGGLAIRRAVAAALPGAVWLERDNRQSPWECLAALADRHLGDASGLQPWWLLRGAEIRRCVFVLPGSEQANRFADLKRQRLLYRLVMGQPNQEDLLEHLQHIATVDPTASNSELQLSPFYETLNSPVPESGACEDGVHTAPL